MKIYVEKEFINHLISLEKSQSKGCEILWSIINDFAEVTWVFNDNINFEDFERWEISNNFYTSISGKGSNSIELNKNFYQEIKNTKTVAQILLTDKSESWYYEDLPNLIVLDILNFEDDIVEIAKKYTFRFIADESSDWIGFSNLKSNLIDEIAIIDKYFLDKFLKTNDVRKLDGNYKYLLNKLLNNKRILLKFYVKSTDADFGRLDELNKKLQLLTKYTKEQISDLISLKFINAELDSKFDFHDRNIISHFYIVKSGKGFTIDQYKRMNTEIECYSFLEKWGYDLIRHRKKMMKDYEESLDSYSSTFNYFPQTSSS